MWVKKTPTEMLEDRRQEKRARFLLAIVLGAVSCVLVSITKNWHSVYQGGDFFVTLAEVPRRLPDALFFGLIVGLLFYRFKTKDRTVVCFSCGKAGYIGTTSRCSCGGELGKMAGVKWKKDPANHRR